MELPSYLLPRPPLELDAGTIAAFERLYADALGRADGAILHYSLSAPKWQFLCYLAETHAVVLHGAGDPAIARFEPRQSSDVNPFGARRAIYAASDGLWPIYFAILDRQAYPMSLHNSCFRLGDAREAAGTPLYFFSISRHALRHRPWRDGVVYLLPRATFEREPAFETQGVWVWSEQWASAVPVAPIARLTVGPGDFPFLSQIRGHDDAVLFAQATADPDGFPWLEDEEDAPP